jgi:hypothetical protein
MSSTIIETAVNQIAIRLCGVDRAALPGSTDSSSTLGARERPAADDVSRRAFVAICAAAAGDTPSRRRTIVVTTLRSRFVSQSIAHRRRQRQIRVDGREIVAVEAACRHTDDGERSIVDDQRLTEGGCAAAERALPVVVAKHDDGVAVRWRVIARAEKAPQRRCRAEQGEVVSGRAKRRDLRDVGTSSDERRVGMRRRDGGERIGRRAQR